MSCDVSCDAWRKTSSSDLISAVGVTTDRVHSVALSILYNNFSVQCPALPE